MSNSSLVNYTKISPNSTNPRKNKITKITIHHMAGKLSVKQCGDVFDSSRKASSNYGIDNDCMVGLYVEEKNRSWCSSSPSNDHQAVTIEVANDEIGGNWHVSDKVLNKLVDLCVDICKRNGIKKLNYTGDSRGNLTRHNMFANTNCPGPYLQSKFPWIEKQVNNKLKQKEIYRVRKSWNDKKSQIGAYSDLNNAKKACDKAGEEYYVFNSSGKIVYPVVSSYKVKVTVDNLHIRNGAGIQHKINGCIKDKGIYTIIKTNGNWGLLKSKAGWICLDYTAKV